MTTTTTMRATIQSGFGEPSAVLRVAEVGQPGIPADGVLVRVRAAAVHVGTAYAVRGFPKLLRPMFRKFVADNGAIGLDMAGVVEAVGPDVTGLAVGDEVLGSGTGAFAEYAVATAADLVSKPANLTFERAAAIGVSAFTALQALRDHGDLRAGQHVLVTGASGGVGTFAVQIAKSMGATVTGVCSTGNLDLVRSLGADHVVDYTQQEVTAGEARYDLILDNVGAHAPRDLRRLLTPGGRLLSNGGPAPKGWFGGIGRLLGLFVTSLVVRQQGRPFVSSATAEDRRALKDLAASGAVTPVVGRVVPLEDAVAAVTAVAAGHNRGTTVIAV